MEYAVEVEQAIEEDWTSVIRPQSPWYDLRLAELWRYRDLIVLFVRRDFVAQYKQTILGPLWHFVNPILTTVVFTIVFGNIAQLSTDGLPPFLFYLAGTVIWGYFSRCLTATSTTFTTNAGIFGKVYFPRLVMPMSVLLSQLIAFALQFVFFAAFLLYFVAAGAPVRVTSWALATPLLLAIMAVLGLGAGIIVSSLTTRYRDLTQLVALGVSLMMYATPVIYPVSATPAGYRALILANPITPVVETFRLAFLGQGTTSLGALLYSAAFAGALLLVGLLLFNRVERTFMDTV